MVKANKVGWVAAICFLMGAMLAQMGYNGLTPEFYGVFGLMLAYGWAAK